MMKIKYIFLGLAILMLSNGCQKDVISSETTETTLGPIETIESSVTGLVTDQKGVALADVTVQYRGDIIKTDENGYFKVENATAVFDGGLLKFEQEGYFKNYKWFYPQLGDKAFVRVIMVKEKLVNNISNSAGGTATLNGGATVSFPPNAFEGGDGEYKIYGHWYDPLGDKLTEEMPGDLRGIDAEEALVQLATYGMVALEIRDSNGNDIQLKDNILATIEFPLPTELASNASQSIKTWSFDEDRAYWIEEGTATLVNGNYVAQVNHFSFWNCDAPFPIIHLSGRLIDKSGTGLPGVKICITDLDRSNTRSGWTSYAGIFAGKIPKDTPLKLVAKDECNGVIYEGEIGPFSEDTDLGDLTADLGVFVLVSGTLLCDGAPLTNGYALIAIPGGAQFVAELDAEGNFEINLPYCELGRILIKGYNLDNNSTIDWLEIEDFESEVFAGDIEMCDPDSTSILDEFIKYKLNGSQELILESPEARLINGQLRIFDSNAQNDNVTIVIDNPQEGAVTIRRISATMVNLSLRGECGSTIASGPVCDEMTGNIDAPYTAIIGDYIEGNSMGALITANGEKIDIIDSFRVRLDTIINESIISGFVWEDTTNDGVRDDIDPVQIPANFSLVTLYRDGDAIKEVFANSEDGSYSFSVETGLYQLSFSKPNGYIFVEQGMGTDPTIDSDVDPTNGNTEQFAVDGTSTYNYDAGMYFNNSFDCSQFTTQTTSASCGNDNGSFTVISSDSALINTILFIETSMGGSVISTIDFTPWDTYGDLAAGDYSWTIYDASGEALCTEDFKIEASLELNCDMSPFVECEGTTYWGGIEYNCNTNNNYTLIWENGETDNFVEIPGPGDYGLTITDDQGCSGEFVVDFNQFPAAKIQGTVWIDSIIGNDNIYDRAFERTPEGVTVNLYQGDNFLLSKQTNVNGYYNFGDLDVDGVPYEIGIEVPTGYELVTREDPNDPDSSSDNDIDPTTERSDEISIYDCSQVTQIMIGLKPQ